MRIGAAVMIVLLVFCACEQDDDILHQEDYQELKGYWTNQQFSNSLVSYEKSDTLVANQYGFAFLPGGKFIERKNSGFCGTPPVIYADYEGSWSVKDSTIDIRVGFWGGNVTYKWQVISIENDTLVIRVVSPE